MKSAILLEEFSRIGGGQMVANSIAKALEGRFKLDVVTDRYHPKLDRSMFVNTIETRYSYYEGINLASLLSRIKKLSVDLKANEKYIRSHDLSVNVHPNIFLFNADINIIHEPFLFEGSKHKAFARYVTNELIRILKVYSIYSEARFILAGNYIKNKIMNECRYLGINPSLRIVHYPVSYPNRIEFQQKKKYVLTFGRINPDKGLETVLKIASNSKATFIIAGAVNAGSERYFKSLMSIKPDNVQIVANPTNEKKRELFSQSSVYLHTKIAENYGLSVAEGIGHGCIPVVPKNGGPWEDIVEHGKFGYGYDTPDEASEIINNVINEDLSKYRYIYDSRDRFSFELFATTISDVVDPITKR